MSQVFILQNQQQLFLSKRSEWVDGRDASVLYRAQFKDEAINQMFEISAKNHNQRIQVLPCPLDEKKQPKIDAKWLAEPCHNSDQSLSANDTLAIELPIADTPSFDNSKELSLEHSADKPILEQVETSVLAEVEIPTVINAVEINHAAEYTTQVIAATAQTITPSTIEPSSGELFQAEPVNKEVNDDVTCTTVTRASAG